MNATITEVRANALRPRILDAISIVGLGNQQYGIEQFAKRAVDVADRHSMRSWKQDSPTTTPADLAVSSLRNLLGFRQNATLKSHHWVLDIFEETLNEVFHGAPSRTKPVADPMVDALNEIDEVGVQSIAPAPSGKPLAQRLLEAYLGRDDDTLLELVAEVEALETKS